MRNIPRNWSVVSSPISRISSSGGYFWGQNHPQRLIIRTHLRAHLKLDNLYFVGYDRRLVAFIESVREHLNSIVVKLVRKSWPVEGERHDIVLVLAVVRIDAFEPWLYPDAMPVGTNSRQMWHTKLHFQTSQRSYIKEKGGRKMNGM